MRLFIKYRFVLFLVFIGLICSCSKSESTNYQEYRWNNYEIAYSFHSSKYIELRVITLQTGKVKRLYKVKVAKGEDDIGKFTDLSNISWSKDGKSILFNATKIIPGGTTDGGSLYLFKLTSKKPMLVRAEVTIATWGINDKVLFDEYDSIYEYNIQTGKKKKLIRGTKDMSYRHPLSYNNGDSVLCLLNSSDIVTYNIKTGRRSKIAEGEFIPFYSLLYNPLSPDGKKIVFLGWGADNPTINLVNIDGTGYQTLYKGKKEDEDGRPLWAPNGEKIVFARLYSPYNIVILDVKTRKTKNIAEGGNPVWFPDGKRILYISGTKLCIIDIVTGKKEVLTDATDISPFAIKPIDKDKISHE